MSKHFQSSRYVTKTKLWLVDNLLDTQMKISTGGEVMGTRCDSPKKRSIKPLRGNFVPSTYLAGNVSSIHDDIFKRGLCVGSFFWCFVYLVYIVLYDWRNCSSFDELGVPGNINKLNQAFLASFFWHQVSIKPLSIRLRNRRTYDRQYRVAPIANSHSSQPWYSRCMGVVLAWKPWTFPTIRSYLITK